MFKQQLRAMTIQVNAIEVVEKGLDDEVEKKINHQYQ